LSKLLCSCLLVGVILQCPIPKVRDYQTGKATYYTVESSSNITASGERYDEEGMTCALRTHKFGHLWQVCQLGTDRCVVVRNNDYGPGNPKAIIDLTPKAFSRLAPLRDGIINVSVRRIR